MKKAFKIIILLVAAIYVVVRVFIYYNSSHILSNQAAFKVYLDLKESNIDSFFGLKQGTFDKGKYNIICQLPVNKTGAKSIPVNFDINTIDCNRSYNKQKDRKYDNSELDGYNFKLVITRGGFPMSLFDADLPLFRNSIIAQKDIAIAYNRGEINNIVITTDSAYNYCTNKHK